MGINITKLPDTMDPVLLIKEEIVKRYGNKCPFCKGNDIEHPLSFHYYDFYPKTGKRGTFTKERFICKSCGAQWESDPYPSKIISDDEYKSITNYLFIGEKEENE